MEFIDIVWILIQINQVQKLFLRERNMNIDWALDDTKKLLIILPSMKIAL